MRHYRILIVLLVFILPTTTEAKCKYVIEEANHVETKLIQLKSKWTKAISARLGKVDGDFYLIVRVQSAGKRFSFDADTPLVLNLSGNVPLTLIPSKAEVAHRTILGLALNHKKSETLYTVEKSVFQTLRTTGILSIDLHYKHKSELGIEHFDIGDKMMRRTREYAGCVLDYADVGR